MELKFEESATSAGTNCINSNQIKSATDKTGKFGPESNSILCAIAERDEQKRDEAIENLLESPGMFIKQGRRLKKAEAKKSLGQLEERQTNQMEQVRSFQRILLENYMGMVDSISPLSLNR